MKTALVHDWLTGMRGGEKCLEALCELYPGAELKTLLHVPGSVSGIIEDRRIESSWIQRLPFAARGYRWYLPLMPVAIEGFDLSEYELVISSSHCVAKGVIPRPDALHVAYMHTPMRYIWDLAPSYFPREGLRGRILLPPILTWLRAWDVASSARVDHFVANSSFVAQRIRKYYRRESTVIHPPVDALHFAGEIEAGEHYLMVSALVPSKGIELALDAFRALGRKLRIVGDGPLLERMRRRAGPNVEFLGRVSDEQLRREYLTCRALVHTAVEDCGIVALEAASAGRPVIALGRGGSLDTVVPFERRASEAPTGIYFEDPTPESLQRALLEFERVEPQFEPEALRAHARRFDRARYVERMGELVQSLLDARRKGALPARGRFAGV